MRRFLLISLKDGRDMKTYGVKKVPTNMKFSFIICVVIAFACCEHILADSRILHDLKYLEYLNDLDRRNVELEYDIHKQWPFHVTAGNNILEEEEEERIEPDEADLDPENIIKLKEIVDMARAENTNRHQNYPSSLLDRLENGYKHLKDTTDRANQLSQYLRYKTPSTQRLEEARMYPPEEKDLQEELSFNDEEESNDDKFLQDDENDFTLNDEEDQTDTLEYFPQNFYSRLSPIKIGLDRHLLPSTFENEEEHHEDNMHDSHDEYQFKEGEEFPHTIAFHEVPLVEDPGEFGVGPSDPRFFRDMVKAENVVTVTQRANFNNKSPVQLFTEKTEMYSKNEPQKHIEILPSSEELSHNQPTDREVEVVSYKPDMPSDSAGVYIIAIVAGISAAATVGLIAVGIGWYNLQKHMKNAEDTDYPSYGIVGPNKDYEKKERDEAGDRRLAQSAQMYHYQHQKQQIIAMGRNPQGHGSQSDTEEEEDEEGNYTVYECPGLASIEGPLEVKNPMFDDDQLATPSQTPLKPTNAGDTK